jgi:predicted DNA-binding protein
MAGAIPDGRPRIEDGRVNKPTGIRLRPDTRERINQMADKTGRSVSATLGDLVEYALADLDKAERVARLNERVA